jgi:hypothetical protein
MAHKRYSVRIDASPRYPMPKTYVVEASNWALAIKHGVQMYFKEHKHMRTDYCKVYASAIGKVLKEEGDKSE